MKKIKSKKAIFALGAVAAGLALLVTTSVGAQVSSTSLWDKIANVAGSVLGKTLADKVEDIAVTDVTNEPQFGAQPGPDAFFPQECHQGICYGYVQSSINPTTTACILRNPINSTTTILYWSANITNNALGDATGQSAGTTHVFDVSTTSIASGGYGSTTPLIFKGGTATGIITGREPINYIWYPGLATTSKDVQNSQVGYVDSDSLYLAANEYLTMRIATGTSGSFASTALTGTCSAKFMQVK